MPSKKHAQLPPSSAERWKNCPGSVTLSKQFPQDTTSAYAEEGTHAHAVAELKLRYANDEINPDNFDRFSSKLDALKKSEYWCGEMDEATNYYRDAVLEIRDSAGEDAELLIEQHFNLDEYVPGGFGTSDAVVIGSGAINVIDLKYGKGIKVNAVGNSQLRLYGLGAAGLFEGIYDFDKVRMTIIQPRLDHISTEEISLEELRRWAAEEIRPAAEEALSGSERTACGDWCQFCPAKAVCRTRAEYCLELARDEFRMPPLLTVDEIGEVLRRAEMIKKWAADVADYALQQALAGEHYDGWKVVEGRSNRKYADEIKVAETLRGAGFDDAMLYERKLLGLTAMEKLVGKKKLTETLGDLIIKPAGKPVLVPESDKREAINTADQAREDFGGTND
jgi:hypothetical protein